MEKSITMNSREEISGIETGLVVNNLERERNDIHGIQKSKRRL